MKFKSLIFLLVFGTAHLTAFAGGRASGGANGTNACGQEELLDQCEDKKITELTFAQVNALYPEVFQRIQQLGDQAFTLEEIMRNSPATRKRWEFSELAFDRVSKDCINATIYELEDEVVKGKKPEKKRVVVACQDREFVRINAKWLRNKKRETKIWTINHELLVGLLLENHLYTYSGLNGRSGSEDPNYETKLRRLNAEMMSQAAGQPRTWRETTYSDFYSVTLNKVYTADEASIIRKDFEGAAKLVCSAFTNLQPHLELSNVKKMALSLSEKSALSKASNGLVNALKEFSKASRYYRDSKFDIDKDYVAEALANEYAFDRKTLFDTYVQRTSAPMFSREPYDLTILLDYNRQQLSKYLADLAVVRGLFQSSKLACP